MEALTPIAAFQALAFMLATGIVFDAPKHSKVWRNILWVLAAILALIGVFANWIGEKWPGALLAMQELGSDPTNWLIAGTAIYFILRPYWKKVGIDRSVELVESNSDQVLEPFHQRLDEAEKSISNLTKQLDSISSSLHQKGENLIGVEERVAERLAARIDPENLTRNVIRNVLENPEIRSAIDAGNRIVRAEKSQLHQGFLEKAKAILAEVSAQDHVPLNIRSKLHGADDPRFSFVNNLDDIGFDLNEVRERLTSVENRMMDAKYFIREAGDERFASNDDKRNWHIVTAKLEYLVKLLEANKNPMSQNKIYPNV